MGHDHVMSNLTERKRSAGMPQPCVGIPGRGESMMQKDAGDVQRVAAPRAFSSARAQQATAGNIRQSKARQAAQKHESHLMGWFKYYDTSNKFLVIIHDTGHRRSRRCTDYRLQTTVVQ